MSELAALRLEMHRLPISMEAQLVSKLQPAGQVQPVAYSVYSHELRTIFTFVKGGKTHTHTQICNRNCIWAAITKIFTIWLFTKKSLPAPSLHRAAKKVRCFYSVPWPWTAEAILQRHTTDWKRIQIRHHKSSLQKKHVLQTMIKDIT